MTEKDAASLTSLVAGLLTGGIETDGADKVVSTGKSRAHKPEDQPDA